MSTRYLAADQIKRVLVEGAPFDANHPSILAAPKEHVSEIRHYCFSVLRHFYRLDFLAQQLLKKPLKKKDYDLYSLILIGILELWQQSKPDYAILNESVKAVPKKKKWAQGLVNATLRQFQKEQTHLLANSQNDIRAKFNSPKWFVTLIQSQWPQEANQIFEQSQAHPPMTLRINKAQTSTQQYLQALKKVGLEAHISQFSEQALTLKTPVDVYKLPGFEAGEVSVQDLSAQIAPQLLDLKPHLKILDACSAPGGKCAHILELEPTLKVDAVELNPARTEKLKKTLKRLNLSANTINADATQTGTWWDGELYDRILLDAPCSGSGVMRRHPDIKLRSNKDSVKNAVTLQSELLAALWPLLKHNGILVYITCSIFQDENVNQINKFLAKQPDCKALSMAFDWGIEQAVGRQILPSEQMDGFYYAKLIKI